MILTGTISDCRISLKGDCRLTLNINEKYDLKQGYDELSGKDKLSIEIKPYRRKRSLNANAYCWKLCTEIAGVLSTSKDEVYETMLRRYGQADYIDMFAGVNPFLYFKYFDVKDRYVDEFGVEKMSYLVYRGSSEYDSYEMSKLIDGIVSEAKDLGIQTDTPDEIARMKAIWGDTH